MPARVPIVGVMEVIRFLPVSLRSVVVVVAPQAPVQARSVVLLADRAAAALTSAVAVAEPRALADKATAVVTQTVAAALAAAAEVLEARARRGQALFQTEVPEAQAYQILFQDLQSYMEEVAVVVEVVAVLQARVVQAAAATDRLETIVLCPLRALLIPEAAAAAKLAAALARAVPEARAL